MSLIYEETIQISSFEVDMFNHWKYASIFSQMAEIGDRHASTLRMGREVLLQYNVAWVLARVKIEMYRLPRLHDTVKIKTWPGTPLKFLYPRYFWFEDENGIEIGKAVSVWTLLDLNKREIIISTSKLDSLYPDTKGSIPLLPVPTHIILNEMKHQVEYTPVFSDFDYNDHVNNARYIEWVFNTLNEGHFEERVPRSLQINYTHEIVPQDRVTFHWVKEANLFQMQGKDDAIVFFTAELEW